MIFKTTRKELQTKLYSVRWCNQVIDDDQVRGKYLNARFSRGKKENYFHMNVARARQFAHLSEFCILLLISYTVLPLTFKFLVSNTQFSG